MEIRLAGQQTSFVEQLPVAIAMFDDQMRYMAASQRYISVMKSLFPAPVFSPADIIGRVHYEVFPGMPSRWLDVHSRVLAGEELAEEEDFVAGEEGRAACVRWSMKPWRSDEGDVGGALLACEIITKEVEARHALAESEKRFRATFENAAVGIAHMNSDHKWLRANQTYCRFVGPINELLAKTLGDVTHPDDLPDELAHIDQMRRGKIDSYTTEKRYLRRCGSIVWGRLTISPVRSPDGSVEYFVRVVEDITERKRAEEELRKSEERFRTSIIHSPVPILLYDDQEQILAVSQSWLRETGYLREELHRIEDWTTRAFGQRSGEMLEYIRRTMAMEPEAMPDEEAIRTRDGGERVWKFVTSSLGSQSDGRHLFLSLAQDVTERKAYEQRIHLLMREANHRIKNILSLVQVIAGQTAARSAQDLERFTERIQALAASQDLLGRNEWKRAYLEDVVRAQLAHFADLIGSRIVVHGPKVRLNAATAQAIGLALHELATNASKYGALSVPTGHVDVGWRADRDRFAMSWTERGGPPVRPPERRGFGSTVIESMAERAVEGEVQVEYAPTGLTWHLSCPPANALDFGR